MATVPSIVVFNDMPPVDEFWLNSGYPGIELMEKSAQAFGKATSDCMVSGYTFNRLRGQSTEFHIYVFVTVLPHFVKKCIRYALSITSLAWPDRLFFHAMRNQSITTCRVTLNHGEY